MRRELRGLLTAAVTLLAGTVTGCGADGPDLPEGPIADGVIGFNVTVQDVEQVCIGGLAGTSQVEAGLYATLDEDEDTRVVWHVDGTTMRVHDFTVGQTVEAGDTTWFPVTVRAVADRLTSQVQGREPVEIDTSDAGDVQFVYDLGPVDLRDLVDPRLLPGCVDRFDKLFVPAQLVLGTVDGTLVSVAVHAPGRDLQVEWMFSIDTPNPLLDPQISIDQTDVEVTPVTFDDTIISAVTRYVNGSGTGPAGS